MKLNDISEVPQFLAIGHVTHDLVNGKIRVGGAALYSTITAHRLGKRAALLTSFGEDYVGADALEGISKKVIPSRQTSTFRNLYRNGERAQIVYSAADFLDAQKLPPLWKNAGIVYLCPVLHEIPQEANGFSSQSLLSLAPQGLMRSWNGEGRIMRHRWEGFETLLRNTQAVIFSEKDIEGNEDQINLFKKVSPLVIVTRARQGVSIYLPDRTLTLGTYPAEEVDPTGAGDCFGAAFLIRYTETLDIRDAAMFASCVGSFVVEREGINGIPGREAVYARMETFSLSCREEPV